MAAVNLVSSISSPFLLRASGFPTSTQSPLLCFLCHSKGVGDEKKKGMGFNPVSLALD